MPKFAMLPSTNPAARLSCAITEAVSTSFFLRRLLCSSEAIAMHHADTRYETICDPEAKRRNIYEKKMKSELMRGLLPLCTTVYARGRREQVV